MNQKYGQIRKRDRTCKELLATGTTLGEHNRQLRANTVSRVHSTGILIFLLAFVLVILVGLTLIPG